MTRTLEPTTQTQHDVDGMARYMLQLAHNEPLRRRMGQAGRRRMQQHFATPNQITKLEDVLLHAASTASQKRTSRDGLMVDR